MPLRRELQAQRGPWAASLRPGKGHCAHGAHWNALPSGCSARPPPRTGRALCAGPADDSERGRLALTAAARDEAVDLSWIGGRDACGETKPGPALSSSSGTTVIDALGGGARAEQPREGSLREGASSSTGAGEAAGEAAGGARAGAADSVDAAGA